MCNFMLKEYITISFQQFAKTLYQLFYVSKTNEILEISEPV